MPANDDDLALSGLQDALALGDMEAVRSALLDLDSQGLDSLEARLGPVQTRRVFDLVQTRRRSGRRGRVIVLHGIMGGQLDSVSQGDVDRVWLNYARLAFGRIAEFRLKPDGTPADSRYTIRVNGMFPEYLPLLTELADQWEVTPFAYDWRLSIDESAAQLADRVKTWTKGEPAHIVAHSMGGLVARRFIQLYPQLWRSLLDGGGMARGGRLVMLGTPNKGSFAIPLILTGKEKTVTKLERLDLRHDMRGLLDIIGTFPGSYQMLPSPLVNGDDQRALLYEHKTWGTLPVFAELLELGRSLQLSLNEVIDPERLLYVAGYDQPTPFRIRIDKPGEFTYQTTTRGDGRVPHELGLLDGVRAFYVRESHGDLPRNRAVLAGIHDLLLTGTTAALESQLPATRAAEQRSDWQRPEAIEVVPAEEFAIIGQPLKRGVVGELPSPRDQRQYESMLLSEYIGAPEGDIRGAPSVGDSSSSDRGVPAAVRRASTPAAARLKVRVVWADITKAVGDVYVAGHYENVAPQYAELALDRVVSGVEDPNDSSPLVLTALTRRGILSGALGRVEFFPWARKRDRLVAIAGMGHPGGFGRTELRRLARSVTFAVGALPNVKTVCSVLLGSGVGNMSTRWAVDGLISGMLEALSTMPAMHGARTLCIVERDFRKATEILEALRELEKNEADRHRFDALEIEPSVVRGEGGAVGRSQCLALALQSTIHAARESAGARERAALDVLMKLIPDDDFDFRGGTASILADAAKASDGKFLESALQLSVDYRRDIGPGADDETPTLRLSFVQDGTAICAAAITNTAVVPERQLAFDLTLVEEAVAKLVDPDPVKLPKQSAFITRLIVPREFRELLDHDGPVVMEVDRSMARVHWEMLAKTISDSGDGEPLGLKRQVARQLRTTFSPPPSAEFPVRRALRALVVGDPGDPAKGHSLPGAQAEALAVAALLRRKGVEVTLMVGSPSTPRQGRLHGIAPASRLDVLNELMNGGFDLLHYAGHGNFDEKHPDRAGWLFEGGLITSRELERMDLAPRLVVANACLSALTSTRDDGRAAAAFLPSVADEFFRRGVRNYIGTAWEVNDIGAVKFASAFYDCLIGDPGAAEGSDATIGAALLVARKALHAEERKFRALWAAYQHYGDPTQRLSTNAGRGGRRQPGSDGNHPSGAAGSGGSGGANSTSGAAKKSGAKTSGAKKAGTKKPAAKRATSKGKAAGRKGAAKKGARKRTTRA